VNPVTPDLALLEAMGTGVVPKLPQHVYDDRFARCRKLMRDRELAALVVYSGAMEFAAREWARYFANYVHPYWNSETFVVIPLVGDPCFLINYGFMLDVAKAGCPFPDVRWPVERFGTASRYDGLAHALRDVLRERGVADGRSVSSSPEGRATGRRTRCVPSSTRPSPGPPRRTRMICSSS
jgi:hypothetical protein